MRSGQIDLLGNLQFNENNVLSLDVFGRTTLTPSGDVVAGGDIIDGYGNKLSEISFDGLDLTESVSIGNNNTIYEQSGDNNVSLAVGVDLNVSTENSFASGVGNITSASNSVAIGSYNNPTDEDDVGYLFTVGNGTDSNNRSNALALTKTGNLTIAQDIYFNQVNSLISIIQQLKTSTPVGSIIQVTAQQSYTPNGYVKLDGSEYSISDYPYVWYNHLFNGGNILLSVYDTSGNKIDGKLAYIYVEYSSANYNLKIVEETLSITPNQDKLYLKCADDNSTVAIEVRYDDEFYIQCTQDSSNTTTTNIFNWQAIDTTGNIIEDNIAAISIEKNGSYYSIYCKESTENLENNLLFSDYTSYNNNISNNNYSNGFAIDNNNRTFKVPTIHDDNDDIKYFIYMVDFPII